MKACIDCIKYEECLKIDCCDFTPKEKPMENKVIFESEEEFYRFCNDCGIDAEIVGRVRREGYIKKSIVEEAEEMFQNWINERNSTTSHETIYKQHEAIQELKSENERLKSCQK